MLESFAIIISVKFNKIVTILISFTEKYISFYPIAHLSLFSVYSVDGHFIGRNENLGGLSAKQTNQSFDLFLLEMPLDYMICSLNILTHIMHSWFYCVL